MPSESKISVSLEFDTATAVCGMLCGVLLWVSCSFTIVWQATLRCLSIVRGSDGKIESGKMKKIEPQFLTSVM